MEDVPGAYCVDQFAMLDFDLSLPIIFEVSDRMRAMSTGHPGDAKLPQRRKGIAFMRLDEISRDDSGGNALQQILGSSLPAATI